MQAIACSIDRLGNIPLGRSKVPFSEPLARARLKREVKAASLVSPKALFIQTNFLRVWRLLRVSWSAKMFQSVQRCLALRFGSASTTRCMDYLRATVTFLELWVRRYVSMSCMVIEVLVAMRRGLAQRRSHASKHATVGVADSVRATARCCYIQ